MTSIIRNSRINDILQKAKQAQMPDAEPVVSPTAMPLAKNSKRLVPTILSMI